MYDHKLDENELNNLAEKKEYKIVFDSLKTTLKQRIVDAGIKPNGLRIQIENAQPMLRQKSITPGDTYDENNKRTYLKAFGTDKKMKLKTDFFYIFNLSFDACPVAMIQIEPTKKDGQSKSPNFIFILADDQGWNGTSVQMMNSEPLSKSDYYETPNLEKLASQGIKFSNAYSSAPVCAPSRYSLQFGMTPARLRLIRVGMNTNHINHDTLLSIPKALKKVNENYIAAHFLENGAWEVIQKIWICC